MQFSVYQESHIGGRKVNQDRMGYSFTHDALLLVLADGMGGHLHGEIAAQVTMQTMSRLFQEQATPYVKKPERFLEESLVEAHHAIHRYRVEHNLSETPRTTVVACLIQHNSALWAHCGDSRLYWMRSGQILGRTRDHSHVETLIARGLIGAGERHTHPDRNKLFNCLGATALPKVELSPRASLLPGDLLLLCSDGLWAPLTDADLVERLQRQTIVRAIPDLLREALAVGGAHADNATALAIMWQGRPVVDGVMTLTNNSEMTTVISTEALPDNLVGSTMLGGPQVGAVDGATEAAEATSGDDLNDDDIEKAIAEIRSAIEKSAKLLK